jgi:hypothetical protein
MIVEENQMIARSLLTFGLHVHVGVTDPERAIQIMNAIRYFLPHCTRAFYFITFLARRSQRIEILSLGSLHKVSSHWYT